jgi:voltage-gated sodium channel
MTGKNLGSTPKVVERCQALVANRAFEPVILAVIVANAVILGLQTFKGIEEGHQGIFDLIYKIIFVVYVVELLIRFTATGWSARAFFADGWNLFDFLVVFPVIVVVFVPGANQVVMLLRLVRLARIVRIVRFLPDLVVIMSAIGRSVRGVASLALATALLIYIYGMLGWIFFSNHDPDNYGNIGRAMLTMFIMLTLENLPDNIKMGQDVSHWTIVFFISYAVVMSFLLFNLFISIVLVAMEEARAVDNAEHETHDLLTRLRSARQALEEAELELRRTHLDDP